MPELPDLTVYIETIGAKTIGRALEHVRIASPFLVRTVEPPLRAVEGKQVLGLRRVGKRIVFALEGDLFLVVHLMISGRFRWRERGAPIPKKLGLAAFDFPNGTLLLTRGEHQEAGVAPRSFVEKTRCTRSIRAGWSRARSDAQESFARSHPPRVAHPEAHAHRPSPARWNRQCVLRRDPPSRAPFTHAPHAPNRRCHHRAPSAKPLAPYSASGSLRLREQSAGEVPEKVTAFHDDMAVHGRYGKPCPDCGSKVQRIVHAENESNPTALARPGGAPRRSRAFAPSARGLASVTRRAGGGEARGRSRLVDHRASSSSVLVFALLVRLLGLGFLGLLVSVSCPASAPRSRAASDLGLVHQCGQSPPCGGDLG